ncbi:DUF397 domain-containing protein [Streptomyces sp. NPDC005408]|uniref:DUF397 domain-containing protein n=1 Tax=Streptomyces sp. NPDC005408 TaxID=3155341 RepID=UPI0033A7F725
MTDPITWQKSSFSGADDNQSCVELAGVDGEIKMRESDDPDIVVTTSRQKLAAFILGVKAGEFDHLI